MIPTKFATAPGEGLPAGPDTGIYSASRRPTWGGNLRRNLPLAALAAFTVIASISNLKIGMALTRAGARYTPESNRMIEELSALRASLPGVREIGYITAAAEIPSEELALVRYSLLPIMVTPGKLSPVVLGRFARENDAMKKLPEGYRVLSVSPGGWMVLGRK